MKNINAYFTSRRYPALRGIGIVGEYVGRVYQEVRRRPRYVVKRTYGYE